MIPLPTTAGEGPQLNMTNFPLKAYADRGVGKTLLASGVHRLCVSRYDKCLGVLSLYCDAKSNHVVGMPQKSFHYRTRSANGEGWVPEAGNVLTEMREFRRQAGMTEAALTKLRDECRDVLKNKDATAAQRRRARLRGTLAKERMEAGIIGWDFRYIAIDDIDKFTDQILDECADNLGLKSRYDGDTKNLYTVAKGIFADLFHQVSGLGYGLLITEGERTIQADPGKGIEAGITSKMSASMRDVVDGHVGFTLRLEYDNDRRGRRVARFTRGQMKDKKGRIGTIFTKTRSPESAGAGAFCDTVDITSDDGEFIAAVAIEQEIERVWGWAPGTAW